MQSRAPSRAAKWRGDLPNCDRQRGGSHSRGERRSLGDRVCVGGSGRTSSRMSTLAPSSSSALTAAAASALAARCIGVSPCCRRAGGGLHTHVKVKRTAGEEPGVRCRAHRGGADSAPRTSPCAFRESPPVCRDASATRKTSSACGAWTAAWRAVSSAASLQSGSAPFSRSRDATSWERRASGGRVVSERLTSPWERSGRRQRRTAGAPGGPGAPLPPVESLSAA